MKNNEVNTAFEILLEEIEIVANGLNDDGAAAFKAGDYVAARRAIELATRLAEFRDRVKALQREWASMPFKRRARPIGVGQPPVGPLPRGRRTPEEAFRRPILEALVELGGKGAVRQVLDGVGQKMQDVLNDYDFQALPSDPKLLRWRNTAQWCRNSLVQEGLMKADSPHGIWEISEAGRRWLSTDTAKS